ncbi:uncharacterized protein LOC120332986 [Styela clava]
MAVCVMHVCKNEGKVTNFTDVSWSKFIESTKAWAAKISHAGVEKDVAFEVIERYFTSEESGNVPPIPPNAGYHRCCYQRYTCKNKMGRRKSHKEKRKAEELDPDTLALPKKMLRSSIPTKGLRTIERPHIFSVKCTICGITRFKRNKVTGKRVLEKLTRCQTLEAGCLLEAAKRKKDEILLLQLRDVDPVASEVRYHSSCYQGYTRFMRRKIEQSGSVDTRYATAFKMFCEEFIVPRIIVNKEIFRLTFLNTLFKRYIEQFELFDSPGYRTSNLKERLKKKFPQLAFIRSKEQTCSDLVFVDTISVVDVIEEKENTADHTVTYTVSEAEMGDDSENEQPTCSQPSAPPATNPQQIFASAMYLRNVINDHDPSFQHWPPTSEHFDDNAVKKSVPKLLVQFISWITGLISDPFCVEVEERMSKKIYSICQDIVYLSKGGRMHMPKHMSLAMAVRHLTGSASLITLLNGLGHCVSNTLVLEYDTALATLQELKGPISIPSCIKSNRPVTLVWDNNDFGEETSTGKGTTHNTNGIIVQRTIPECEQVSGYLEPTAGLSRDRKRSFQPSSSGLVAYRGQKKAAPQQIDESVVTTRCSFVVQEYARKLDQAYILTRIPGDSGESFFPTWTGFNTKLVQNVPLLSSVGYLPVIDASPTEMDTVLTVLERSVQIADKLKLQTIVIVFDQAIYSKAQTIRWQTELFKNRTVLRLGEFHTAMTYLACIGKWFGDAGLRDIIIEAELCAEGSLTGVLSGHHYNRSVRCHKLIYEALHRLRWQSFLEEISETDYNLVKKVISDLKEHFPSHMYAEVAVSPEYNTVYQKYVGFIKSKSKCPTFRFWSSYLEMIEILLLFLRATKEGNWALHLSAVRAMCPWMFITNRNKYARYLPIYYLEMMSLQETHPDVHNMFVNGEFVVQRQARYGFSQVACDMAIEQTCNRDTKTKGGMVGFTLNKGASQRWILSHPERAQITKACFGYAGRDSQGRDRKDLDKPHSVREESAICRIIECMEGFINPFSRESEDLIHIVSGVVVPKVIASDIMTAEERGRFCFTQFCKDRLLSNKKSFHDTISNLKLKSFSSVGKIIKTKCSQKEMDLKSERNLMARLAIIGRERGIKIEDLLKYSLGPLPLSLAYTDGGLMRTSKAKLMHYLCESIPSSIAKGLPTESVWILDAMAVLQSINHRNIPKTFGDLAALYLLKLVKIAQESCAKVVHLVMDRYPSISIKNAERHRRAKHQAVCQTRENEIYSESQRIPLQWKKYLSCGKNKELLMEFFIKSWSQNVQSLDFTLFIGYAESCLKICFASTSHTPTIATVDELECSHEEADTRLMLHAKFAANSCNSIVIQSPDTDVLILCIAKYDNLGCSLWFETGVAKGRRVIDVGAIHCYLSQIHPSAPMAMVGAHAFTGCDSVSSFYGKGKVKPIKLVLEESKFIEFFAQLGRSFDVNEASMNRAEEFVCSLYGENMKNVNDARARLFKTGKHMDHTLPPNSDSLKEHVLRANYQAAIHHLCLEPKPIIPSPIGHGWVLDDGVLQVKWMDLLPAPKSVLELANCKCKKNRCQNNLCTCAKNNLNCTEFCFCVDCQNQCELIEEKSIFETEIDENELDIEIIIY